MADIPFSWRAYAAQQSCLRDRSSVDATSWAVEEGLNQLLNGDEALRLNDAGLERVKSNAARRARYVRALVAKNIIRSGFDDGVAQIEARLTLATIERQVVKPQLALLLQIASGDEPSQVAAALNVTMGTLRTRIARARSIARRAAA